MSEGVEIVAILRSVCSVESGCESSEISACSLTGISPKSLASGEVVFNWADSRGVAIAAKSISWSESNMFRN